MPMVPSKDEGNVDGYVHSHRFPGANTAVPTANEDQKQLLASQKFLQDKQLSVDIFAISPAEKTVERAKNARLPSRNCRRLLPWEKKRIYLCRLARRGKRDR